MQGRWNYLTEVFRSRWTSFILLNVKNTLKGIAQKNEVLSFAAYFWRITGNILGDVIKQAMFMVIDSQDLTHLDFFLQH